MSTEPIRVFVIDDDELDRMALRRLLADAEHIEVQEFSSCAAAFDELMAARCDCLLLDYHMPDTNGLEFLDELAAAGVTVPTILVTGDRGDEIALDSMQRGALDFMSKDRVDREVLLAKIRTVRLLHAAGRRTAALQQDLQDTVVQLQREVAARESLLGVVSHDLRGPINNIKLAMSLLESDDAPARAIAIASVERAIARAERLIGDLLDVARLSGDHLELERREVQARALIDAAVLDARPAAEAKQLTLRIESDDDDGSVCVDRDRIIQVIDNLLRNAIKYSPHGGTIRIGARTAANDVTFHVADEGPGLRPEDREHVFDRFWQARDKHTHEGSGLGLAIAKGIVTHHGGEIDVGPAEGGGARFVFTLPRTHAQAAFEATVLTRSH